MKKKENFEKTNVYNILKNIELPEIDNKKHEEYLWEKIETENNLIIQKTSLKVKIQKFFTFRNLVFNYSFFIIILFFFILILFNFALQLNQSTTITFVDQAGNITINNKIIDNTKLDYKLTYNDIISMDGISQISFILDNQSLIKINKNSKLKFLSYSKKKNDNIIKFNLLNGSVNFDVNLPTKSSVFKIITDLSDFTVEGTKFTIKIFDNKDVKLDVIEGKVKVDNILKINKKDPFYKKFENISKKMIILNQGQSIILNKKLIEKINEDYKIIKKNHKINNIINKETIEKLKTDLEKICIISNLKEGTIEKEEQSKNKKFIVNKVSKLDGIILSEDKSAISASKKFLYIANNIDNKIYAININTKKIEWNFNNENVKKITGIPTFFKNQIFYSTPESIIILNENGTLKKSLDDYSGIIYWSTPVINNNTLYIPGSQNIFIYKDDNIKKIDILNNIMGQLYISIYNNEIYGIDLNMQYLFKINLMNNNEKINILKLKNRSLMPPVITNDYIFIADISGNLYKINKQNYSDIKIITLDIAIISKLIHFNNNLYLIAINGYFYKVNSDNFDTFEKIDIIDNNPYEDKYLLKELLVYKNGLFYNSDKGNLFYYDLETNQNYFINISEYPLISTPVVINNIIYIFDNKAQLYSVSIE